MTYDSVQHETLLRALIKSGASRHFIRAIMAMYDSPEARIPTKTELAESLLCPRTL